MEKLPEKERLKKVTEKAAAAPKLTPEEADAANDKKNEEKKAAQKIQDDASTAKKDAETKAAVAHTAKVNKESTEEVIKGEKEIEVAKEVKEKKIKAQKIPAAELEKPWGTKSEVWTANMPEHLLEGYAQKGRKDVKEHELVQNKAEEEESEDEDSGDESDE